MRIIVYMLFDLESQVSLLHLHTDVNIQWFGSLGSFLVVFAIDGKLWIIGIFYPFTFVFFVFFYIHTFGNEFFIQFVQQIEFTGQINHRAGFAFLINHKQRWDSGSFCHKCIVGTECRCNVNDTGTIFRCHIISGNYPECFGRGFFPSVFSSFYRFYPWNQLLIFHTNQVSTFIFSNHFEWHQFIAWLVVFQSNSFCLFVEMSI